MPATRASPSLSSFEELRPLTVPETSVLIRKSSRDVLRKIADGTFKTVEPQKRGRTPLITLSSVRS